MPCSRSRIPVTFDIIQNSLEAIADEMFAAMRKTAMSAIIYEVLDLGTGITDADGEIAASGAGIPAFIGVLDKAVKAILRKHDPGDIDPGDVFAVNDPYYGGVTHLNDIVLAMPVFVDGTLVAWTANDRPLQRRRRHGRPARCRRTPTRFFRRASAIPAIKIIEAGKPNQTVHRHHDRQLAPARLSQRATCGRRSPRCGSASAGCSNSCEKYGDGDVSVSDRRLSWIMASRSSLEGAREAAQGRVRTRRRSRTTAPSTRSRSTITDKTFVVDLTDNPDQDRGPTNASRDGVIDLRANGLQVVHATAGARQRWLVPAAAGA